MRPAHLGLAVLIAAIWGLNFIALKFGVNELPPFAITAARFVVSAFPAVLIIRRPEENWRWVAGFGLVLGVGQFGFLFMAVKLGLPAGLTSLVMQVQAFWTMLFAWFILDDRPGMRQIWGAVLGFAGIAVIAFGRWSGPDLLPLGLCLIASAGWAGANIISKMAKPRNTLSFVVWSSLWVPIPMICLSLLFESHAEALQGALHPSLTLVLSVLYTALLSTLFGYAAWNYLFNHYPASTVAPFSLLVPLFGVLGGTVVFHERFDLYEVAGALIIVCGLLYANFGPKKEKAER